MTSQQRIEAAKKALRQQSQTRQAPTPTRAPQQSFSLNAPATGPVEPPKDEGFLKGIARRAVAPFTKVAASGVRAIQSVPQGLNAIGQAATGQDYGASLDKANATMAEPMFGSQTFAGSSNLQNLGTAVETGSYLIPGSSARKLFIGGAVSGGGGSLAEGDSLPQAGLNAVTGGVVNRYAPGLMKGAFNKLPQGLKNSVSGAVDTVASKAFGVADDVGTTLRKGTVDSRVAKIDKVIDDNAPKILKPSVAGKTSLTRQGNYQEDTRNAFKTIVENKNSLKLVDEDGVVRTGDVPKNLTETAQAVDQSLKQTYKQFNDMAKSATGQGIRFDAKPTIAKLQEYADDTGYSPDVRKYAKGLISEIEELNGQSPEIVERRIAELNSSLGGVFDGRIKKGQAQLDASVAQSLRKTLDDNIELAEGPGYQELRNQYKALKAIEADVNRRVLAEARKSNKGLLDFADIFSGGEILSGIVTANPALFARGVVQKGITNFFKGANDPDKLVAKMFAELDDVYTRASKKGVAVRPTPEAPPRDPLDFFLNTVERGQTIRQTVKAADLVPPNPNSNKAVKVNNYQKDYPKYIPKQNTDYLVRALKSRDQKGKGIDVNKVKVRRPASPK